MGPDVRYADGRYLLYFTVTDTTLNPGDDSAIGVATAPTPVGPWTPSDEPVIDPRPAPGDGFLWTFDPAAFADIDGTSYLYYGSYFGGLHVQRLAPDGRTAVGQPRQVAIDNRYDPGHPERQPVDRGRAHAIATDARGRDYLVYHALDRSRPWLTTPFGINRRPMLLDRIDWIDGWPRTRAGAGPSDTPQPAPVTGSAYGITADDPAASGFTGLVAGRTDPQAGRTATLRGRARTVADVDARSVRIRLDLSSTDRLARTLTVRALATQARRWVPEPQTPSLLVAEEFNRPLSADWTWVRRDPDAAVQGGAVAWPVQAADLVGGGNNAGVLLRDTPDGRWIAETKVTVDLGENTVRNFQQAGLGAYRNAAGEHLYRAGTSRDGRSWSRGAVWTFGRNTTPRVGLLAHGGDTPAVVARFDYLQFYRSTWAGPIG